MQDSAVYAVPSQVLFKRWPALVATAASEPGALTRSLLLRNPSLSEEALLLLVPPRSGRFQLHTAGFVSSSAFAAPSQPSAHDAAVEASYVTPDVGAAAHGGVAFTLPPNSTLTCTVSFVKPSNVAASSQPSYQDALFAYTPSCALGPALCVPLLALAADDPPPAGLFDPPRVRASPAPPSTFWTAWMRRRAAAEEEALELARRAAASANADVFVVDQDQQSDDDDGNEENADERDANGMQDDPVANDALSRQEPRAHHTSASLSSLGARLAAVAAYADAEELSSAASSEDRAGHSSCSSRDSREQSSGAVSSRGRTGLTSSAGVVREGFAARLHSSHGMRSARGGNAVGLGHAAGQLVPGQQHVFQAFARPATAEQRHLADRLDVSFVAQTESAIDELVEDDLAAAAEEEEADLQRTARDAAAAAAAHASQQSQFQAPMEFDASSLLEGAGSVAALEQDEADFYRQLMVAERARAAAAVAADATQSTPSRPSARPPSSSASSSRPRISGARQSPQPLATTPSRSFGSTTRVGASPSPSPSPPGSASSRATSSSARSLAASMQRLQLQQQLQQQDAAAEWNERLASEQEMERRRYFEQHSVAAQMGARPPSATALGGLKLPKI